MTPKLESARFTVTMPQYTGRPPYDGPLPTGGLIGLPGTTVKVTAKSNRPLGGGTLQLVVSQATEEVKLTPTQPGSREVTGSFTMRSAGKFSLGVTDEAGNESRERLAGSITVLADESPFVRITQPPITSLATPSAVLPVHLIGEDDFGVAGLQLYRSLNDSRALPLEFELPQQRPTRLDAAQALPLAAYGLEPGDVIKLFARVEDNDPSGAKGTESPIATIRIIAQDEYERMLRLREGIEMLTSKYREAQRRLESLKEEEQKLLNELQEGTENPETIREQLKKLSERIQKESLAIREAAAHSLEYDLDEKLNKHLDQLADMLDKQVAELDKAAGGAEIGPKSAAELLEQLLKQLAEKKEGFQKDVMEPLEHLERIYPLIEDQARFVAIYQQQRDLADRAKSLVGHDAEDDPRLKARMRNLEEEQRRIREELAELLDDIENHVGLLPQDERLNDLRKTALDFVQGVRASGAQQAMLDAETALVGFLGTEAHAKATKAADILRTFLGKCESTQAQAGLCLKFAPGLEAGLGNTVEQLLAEMGLSPGGSTMGQSGYSTRRNSLDNTGLFGRLPGMDQAPGQTGRKASAGEGSGVSSKMVTSETTSTDDHGEKVSAGGAAGVTVPPRYRRRVGAYFQRVAEESQSR